MNTAMSRIKRAAVAIICAFVLACMPECISGAAAEGRDYISILYNGKSGMPTSEANDILQSDDGFIWIASYSGLIRYDGNNFERVSGYNDITSANCLMLDSTGRLWVGTNDNGVVIWDNGRCTVIDQEEGLPSSAVKAMVEDSTGNVYVGTTSGVCRINEGTNRLTSLISTDIGNRYIVAMDMTADDTLICVTNDGIVYRVKNSVATRDDDIVDAAGDMITTVYVDPASGAQYYGTQSSFVYVRTGAGRPSRIDCGKLTVINSLYRSSTGALWICADNGVGCITDDSPIAILDDMQLNNSVERIMEDFEGNIWFTSSRQGVLKRTANYFTDTSVNAGVPEAVVNAVMVYDGTMYMGTDSGLYAISSEGTYTENTLTEYLNGVRVRCMMVDSDGVLWVCTYGDTGFVRFDGSTIRTYNTTAGMLSGKVRSAMQASDGTIYIATSNGINIMNDGRIQGSIGKAQGLANPEVLSLCEGGDGIIYAGTDGGGIFVIKDGIVADCINQEDGLRSDIVMRIKRDENSGGYWIITSNSLAFYDGETIKNIDKFPYSNNFDIYFSGDGGIWVLSSAGLYVTSSASLLSDETLEYTFYNYESGIPDTPTANSFSYYDEANDRLYIAGSSSAYSIGLGSTTTVDMQTRVAIPSVRLNGETEWLDSSMDIEIAPEVQRVRIDAYALNYTLADPLVQYYLEGFDPEPIVVRNSSLENIVYTNLSAGSYVFHFSVIDQTTGDIIDTKTVTLHKSVHFADTLYFWILMGSACITVAVLLVYQFSRQKMNRILLKQSESQKERIQDALDREESASRAKTDFMARMSHDLRTPLNGIIGMTELLRGETETLVPPLISAQKSEDIGRYLGKITSSSGFLLGLVNDMLDIDKIQSGKVVLQPEAYSTADLNTYIKDMFQSTCSEKGVKLALIEPETPLMLSVDRLRCNQIFTNLVSNAIKFTDRGGIVTFSQKWNRHGDSADGVITVRDTGKGMTLEFQKRMFEPFVQEYASKTAVGSGLGLTIVKQLTDLMGGRVEVHSAPGEGTEFIIRLTAPVSDEKPTAAKQTAEFDAALLNGSHVLLCEDHPVNAEVARKLLERQGVNVTLAGDGRQGVDIFASSAPEFFDAILMDIRMPVMDGLSATKSIRALERIDAHTVPIIAMTANAYDDDRRKSLEAGMNDHVAKPIEVRTLYSTLAKWIAVRRGRA